MKISALSIPGSFQIDTHSHTDQRGAFLEWFSAPAFSEAIGHDLELRQANMSVSAAGVVRGIHFADVPPGQAKYVTCVQGAVLDVIVDIRIDSPTFGQWCSVLLDDTTRRAVYISQGLGHAFMALQDDSTVVYLCSSEYNPSAEHGINPLDPTISIDWPTKLEGGRSITPILSKKDAAAPSLHAAKLANLLPVWKAQ